MWVYTISKQVRPYIHVTMTYTKGSIIDIYRNSIKKSNVMLPPCLVVELWVVTWPVSGCGGCLDFYSSNERSMSQSQRKTVRYLLSCPLIKGYLFHRKDRSRSINKLEEVNMEWFSSRYNRFLSGPQILIEVFTLIKIILDITINQSPMKLVNFLILFS